jgi:hypothetical protein
LKGRPNTSFTAAHLREGDAHQIARPQSTLQKHKADAPGLVRSKSGLKKTHAETRAINQSVGIISRPMMNNHTQHHSPGHSTSMLQPGPGGASLNTGGIQSANSSAGQARPGKNPNGSSSKMSINWNLPRMMQPK